MVNGDEASEVQLEPDKVKVKVALPAETAVITPWLVMVAMLVFELVQIPPELGVMVV